MPGILLCPLRSYTPSGYIGLVPAVFISGLESIMDLLVPSYDSHLHPHSSLASGHCPVTASEFLTPPLEPVVSVGSTVKLLTVLMRISSTVQSSDTKTKASTASGMNQLQSRL